MQKDLKASVVNHVQGLLKRTKMLEQDVGGGKTLNIKSADCTYIKINSASKRQALVA